MTLPDPKAFAIEVDDEGNYIFTRGEGDTHESYLVDADEVDSVFDAIEYLADLLADDDIYDYRKEVG